MLFDNTGPRYLPHLSEPGILHMGLRPLQATRWIETDSDLPDYHAHKQRQRAELGRRVYNALPCSGDAQRETRDALLAHLVDEQAALYRRTGEELVFIPSGLVLPTAGDEALWTASLWLADDLVIMQEIDGEYRLAAASLCSPSSWLLEEKFGRPLAEIHATIPGFDAALTPRVDRFLHHLKPDHPVERFNWSLQAGDALCDRGQTAVEVQASTPLYYRVERQTLRRLPVSGAIVFTIRVYLHPLALLQGTDGAMPALLDAIDAAPAALARYKGFTRLAPALQKYRVDAAGG